MDMKTFQTLLGLGLGISAFLMVFGFGAMAFATIATSVRYKKARWVAIPASVRESYVSQSSTGRGGVMYVPVIEYHYEYAGNKHHSRTISPDLHYAGSSEPSFAEKWVSLLPVGTQVTAYVDRDNPTRAVLFPEYRYGWWHAFLVAFAIFGFSNFLLLAVFAGVHFL